MKIITTKITKRGMHRTTIEHRPGIKLIEIHPDEFYKLGYPIEDIVGSDVLTDAEIVSWCPVTQKWVES